MTARLDLDDAVVAAIVRWALVVALRHEDPFYARQALRFACEVLGRRRFRIVGEAA